MVGRWRYWCANGCGKKVVYVAYDRNFKPRGYYCQKCGYYYKDRATVKNLMGAVRDTGAPVEVIEEKLAWTPRIDKQKYGVN